MAKVIIVQGKLDGGKTTYMNRLSGELLDVDGIITIKDAERRSYFFHEVSTRLNYMGLSADMILSEERFGRYFVSRSAFERASEYLLSRTNSNILLDEVGKIEILGGGFADALRKLLKRDITLYIAVRDDFVQGVIDAFGIENPHFVKLGE